MLTLTIRTDKPEAEIGLYNDDKKLAYETWHAHRELAETIHSKITELLKSQGRALGDVAGVVCYKGPGSFTGLRIGLTVGNTLAYALSIPVIAANGTEWQIQGIHRLQVGESDEIAQPEYGAPVHITAQKK